MIKNIVFDFGGVIVDIDRDKAVQAFIKLGLADADTRLDKYHQTGIFQELEEGKLSADEFRKQLGDLCGRPLTMEETKQAWLCLLYTSGSDFIYPSMNVLVLL